MDTRRLSAFVRMVDAGAISRAARQMGVAQPALSQQLAILEHEVGATLLERSAAGVRPTEAGRALYARAQLVLRLVDEIPDAVKRAATALAGVVPVGLPPTLIDRFGVPLIARVQRQAPDIRLQLIEGGAAALTAQVEDGRVSLAVIADPTPADELVFEALFEERLFVVSGAKGPEIARKLKTLAASPWIVTRRPHAIRTAFDAVFAREGLEPNVIAEADSLPVVLGAVAQGLGLTVLPMAAVPSALKLRSAPFSNARRVLHLARRKTPIDSPATTFVAGTLREIAKTLGE